MPHIPRWHMRGDRPSDPSQRRTAPTTQIPPEVLHGTRDTAAKTHQSSGQATPRHRVSLFPRRVSLFEAGPDPDEIYEHFFGRAPDRDPATGVDRSLSGGSRDE